MRTFRSRSGPFQKRPHYGLNEIEKMCIDELDAVGLLPTSPEPVRIDRFVEKRFKPHEYADLPNGVLGYTKFGPSGVEAIVIAKLLDDGRSGISDERRVRTTLAHEAGHGLLHAHLFASGLKPTSLFGDGDNKPEILCRDIPHGHAHKEKRGYDGRWWEFQANKAIGGLLMPRRLVEIATEKFTVETGLLGTRRLAPDKRESAAWSLADVFDVNPIVARFRLDELFPVADEDQLSL
jgi:hypothetical protein